MAGDNPKELPQRKVGDWAHTIVKAGLSAIPIVGGSIAELFAALIVPPLAKRRDEWLKSIAEGLNDLQSQIDGFTIESLVGNETFVTSVMHASQAAVRNHQKEKLEALRNAILNVASGRGPDEDLQLMFMSFIDTLTPSHLRILCFFQRPEAYVQNTEIPGVRDIFEVILDVLERIFPELRGQRRFSYQIIKDLSSRSLMYTEPLLEFQSGWRLTKRTTDMGDRFIAFISSPLQ